MPISQTEAAAHRYRVDRKLKDIRMDPRGRLLQLWNYILVTEINYGTQFLRTTDGQLFVVLGGTDQIIKLPPPGRGGARWHAYFHAVYGLVENEPAARWSYASLLHHVQQYGTLVEPRRFAAYDRATKTAYMSAYNGRMYKIAGTAEVEDIACGEDGIFFVDDDDGIHCTPNVGQHGILLDRLLDLNFAPSGLSGISPAQQRMALITWIFALGLPDLMRTKPLILLEGVKGSGKTLACGLIQLVLMGYMRPMILQRNKEDDFGVTLLRAPIALFDNTDSYIDWVPDAICAYATSGTWTRRRLYTDDESLVIKPHAFIAVASRNPSSFRRDDVADRLLILRLERRETFTSVGKLEAEIEENRALLLGEYMWYLGQIVQRMRDTATDLAPDETHRMADFAAFARVVGWVLDWKTDDVEGLMTALQAERDAFVNEEDPLIDLLNRWCAYPARSGVRNVGRLINAIQLYAELETVAQGNGIVWKSSPRILAQNLRASHIEREFYVETKPIGGQKVYQIWRHSDPRLRDRGGWCWMRPTWDDYFLAIARVVATRGTCDRLQVGAVTVRNNRILTTGYNGAPSGLPDCDTDGHQLVKIGDRESCVRTLHGEENAILQAAVLGLSLKDATIYTTASPCYDCAKRICQVGIRRVVYATPYTSARSSSIDLLKMFEMAGVWLEHRPVSPIE